MIIWCLIIAAVIGLDQGSKWLIITFLEKDEPFVLIDGVLRFSYVENTGAAFGSFDEQRWVFIIISIVGILGMLAYLIFFRPESKWACVALSFIIGGGIGNMIDRTFYMGSLPHTMGKNVVIDFIDFYAFPTLWQWVFNIADSFVCIGAAMLILWCILSLIEEVKADRAKKQALPENEMPQTETATDGTDNINNTDNIENTETK